MNFLTAIFSYFCPRQIAVSPSKSADIQDAVFMERLSKNGPVILHMGKVWLNTII